MNVDQFREAIRCAGLEPPEAVEPGKLHRFPTNGKGSDDAGWCKLFADGGGGVFGDFRSGLSETWQAQREKPFTPAERESFRQRCAAERKEREAEAARRHADAREKAAEILKGATGDPATHPYAIKKVISFGPLVRRGLWPQRGWTDALLIPIIYGADGRVWSIEAINVDGSKDSLKGAPKRGGFHPLEKIRGASRVLIAEGLANAAVGWGVDGSPAAAAMGKTNLLHAALAVRKLAPEAEIIILADNDLKVPKEAQDAARSTGGRVAVPELEGRKCDFWDLWHELGAEAVQSAIASAKAPDIEGTTGHSTAEDLDATLRRLAALSAMDYDRVRMAEAEQLLVRRSTLDAEVEKARREAVGSGQGDLFPEIEPWPEPVDGAELLIDLVDAISRYVVLPKHADTAVALWILFTHAIGSVDISPIFAITSPEKRCGKSTVLALLARLVPRSMPAANITPAALFRAVEAWQPTLLIDEADSFLRNREEMRGILNSGHTRGLAFVIRTVGDDHEPRRFSTWGAKAIALIGKLPDTLADRSIEIPLKRKLPGEQVQKLRHADPELFRALARRCERFTADRAEKIRAARPSMPDSLHDRAQDNWEPLIAIADLAGGDWPKLAREAALALSGAVDAQDDNIRVQLLSDIRDVFKDRGADRVSSEDLTSALISLDERPWADYSRGKPLTMAKLARLLRPFGVVSGSVRLPAARTPKGYLREQFTDAFRRYLASPSPKDPPFKAQQRHNVGGARVSEDFESATAGGCGVSENAPEPSCDAACGVVADSKPPPWETRL